MSEMEGPRYVLVDGLDKVEHLEPTSEQLLNKRKVLDLLARRAGSKVDRLLLVLHPFHVPESDTAGSGAREVHCEWMSTRGR